MGIMDQVPNVPILHQPSLHTNPQKHKLFQLRRIAPKTITSFLNFPSPWYTFHEEPIKPFMVPASRTLFYLDEEPTETLRER